MYVNFKVDMLGNGKTTSLQEDGENDELGNVC
jgi:hypothetical protein